MAPRSGSGFQFGALFLKRLRVLRSNPVRADYLLGGGSNYPIVACVGDPFFSTEICGLLRRTETIRKNRKQFPLPTDAHGT